MANLEKGNPMFVKKDLKNRGVQNKKFFIYKNKFV